MSTDSYEQERQRRRKGDRERNQKKSKKSQKHRETKRKRRGDGSPLIIPVADEKQVSQLFKIGSVVFIVFLFGVSIVSIFSDGLVYIPSFNAKKYAEGDNVPLTVNRIVSEHVPIPFQYSKLPTCDVDKPPSIESLGDVILGNRNDIARIDLRMKQDQSCVKMCDSLTINSQNVKTLMGLIGNEYQVEWYIDNLPVATKYQVKSRSAVGFEDNQTEKFTYLSRYPLGIVDDDENYIFFNHFQLNIYINEAKQLEEAPLAFVDEEEPDKYNIVFVEIQLKSYDYNDDDKIKCSSKGPLKLKSGEPKTVTYSYSVNWISDNTEWTERWNRYLESSKKTEIHWFAILNSTLIVLFLTGIIGTILSRTIYRDIDRYNTPDPELMDETGWKQVSGDVFRAPKRSGLFAVLIGTGVQLTIMAFITISFALLGFLSPANRGGVVTALIILFVWLGIIAGYFSTWALRIMNKDKSWTVVRRNSMLTGVFVPGIIFALFFFLNFFLWGAGSVSAAPIFTMIAVLCLWMFISVPLCLIGSFLSFRRGEVENPVQVNMIAKGVLDQEWYLHPVAMFLMGGILPFGAVFIEYSSIISSIWHQQYYFLFGYLYLVFVLLFLTCAEVSIVAVYFQLCAEDYRWWWRSYFVGSSCGFYAFCYTVFYFISNLELHGFVSIILFLGYSLLMSILIGAITGTIGFISAYFFVSKIYSEIHAK